MFEVAHIVECFYAAFIATGYTINSQLFLKILLLQ